jgi:hypothetical protein
VIKRPNTVDAIDIMLMALFLFGIATGLAMKFSAGVPIPAVVAGAAGGLLLLKHLDGVGEGEILGLFAVLMVYFVSVLCADGQQYLNERFKGLIQLSYSLVIGYGFFLAARRFPRRTLARIFLITCLIIIVGAALENYTGFRAISDAFRHKFYDFGVYKADARDEMLYGAIRPKFFTSEPSALTFAFTLFAFSWYVLAASRWKAMGYLALLAIGYRLMHGPTLLLGLPLAGAYELLLAPRRPRLLSGGFSGTRLFIGLAACIVIVIATAAIGSSLFAARLSRIAIGADPSFFAREIGPFKVAMDVIQHHPIAGAGVTGEEFIAERVQRIYYGSRGFTGNMPLSEAAHLITNYFWTHWIYLGVVFGTLAIVVVTAWLKVLRTPSPLFCWTVWVLFGQASGGYVTPKTWTVLLLAAALAILHERQPVVPILMRRPASPRAWRHARVIGLAAAGRRG